MQGFIDVSGLFIFLFNYLFLFIYFFFCVCVFYTEIQDGRQKWQENIFCEKPPVDSADTLPVKNFVKIALFRSISEINTFLCLIQAAKSGGKMFFLRNNASRLCIYPAGQKFCQKRSILLHFGEKSPVDSADILRVKNYVEIALSRSISEINAFLHLTQKFKMAAKSGGKTNFVKSCH